MFIHRSPQFTPYSVLAPNSCDYFFFFNDTATTEIYTLSLHDALPISDPCGLPCSSQASHSRRNTRRRFRRLCEARSEEHTSELQSLRHLVCRLLLEKKKKNKIVIKCSSARKKISPDAARSGRTRNA